MRILYCSDFHYQIKYPHAEKGYKSIFNKVENIEKRISEVLGRKDIDLILIGGDLCEDGSIADYKRLKEMIDENIQVPYLLTLGNHDIRSNFYQGFFNQKASKPYNEVMDIEDYRIIAFDNSNHKHSAGIITSEQKEWLIETIKNSHDKKVIIMMHHHILAKQHEMPPLSLEEDLLEIISHRPVELILTAHTHYPYEGSLGDARLLSCGGLNFQAYWDGDELVFTNKASYTIIDLEKDEIEVIELDDPLQVYARLKVL